MDNFEQTISDSILKSIDILVDKKISELNYSKTIKAEIIDDSTAEKGTYIVKYETSEFTAYTQDTSLKNGDLVQVLISNNDSSEKRIILNKIVEHIDEYITNEDYKKYIDVTTNLIDTILLNNQQLVANHSIEEKLLWSTTNIQDFSRYTKLNLSGKFSSLLSNAIKGKYGLRLEVVTPDDVINLDFNSNEMLGNSLNYIGDNLQRKIFNIKDYNIQSMSLFFYQEKGSFIDEKELPIPSRDSMGNVLPPNLLVKDIELSLGFFTDELTPGEDDVYITLAEGYTLNYTHEPKDMIVELKWLHWKTDNSSLFTTEEIASQENFHIEWYQYQLYQDALAAIQTARSLGTGVFQGITTDAAKDIIEEELVNELGCPHIDNNNWQRLTDYDDSFECKVILDGDATTHEQVCAFVYFDDGKVFQSNIITFENQNKANDKDGAAMRQGAVLETFNDKYEGNYYIYTTEGILNNEHTQTRVLKLHYYNSNGDEVVDLNTDNRYSIEWDFPTENTMLTFVKEGTDLTEAIYKINGQYTPSATNNTIKCTVIYDNEGFSYDKYTASFTFNFGYSNISNEGVNLVIVNQEPSIEDGLITYSNNAIQVGETEVGFVLKRFDANGTLEKIEHQVQWAITAFEVASGNLINSDITLTPQGEDTVILKKPEGKTFDFSNAYILKAITDDGLAIELPLAITANKKEYNYISGATSVIYRKVGVPVYNKEPYKLFSYNGTEQEGLWSQTSGEDWFGFDNNTLVPSQIYLDNHNLIAVQCTINNEIKWLQPISINETPFESKLLNSWDGKSVSTDEGAVLAPMIAAGKKEENDGTFTGVIMGDWEEESSGSLPLTGLYGFHQGQTSFGFTEAGTGFIGKQGLGRIQFDGTRGLITSGDFEKPGEGNNNTNYYSGTSWIDLTSEGLPINEDESLMVKFGDNFKVTQQGDLTVAGNITATSFYGAGDLHIGQNEDTGTYNFNVDEHGNINMTGDITANSLIADKDFYIGKRADGQYAIRVEYAESDSVTHNNPLLRVEGDIFANTLNADDSVFIGYNESTGEYNFQVYDGNVTMIGDITATRLFASQNVAIGYKGSGSENNATNYNFYIDTNGNINMTGVLTATQLKAKRDVRIGLPEDATDNINNYNFYVGSSGNVRLKGSIDIGGSINLSTGGAITNFYKITSHRGEFKHNSGFRRGQCVICNALTAFEDIAEMNHVNVNNMSSSASIRTIQLNENEYFYNFLYGNFKNYYGAPYDANNTASALFYLKENKTFNFTFPLICFHKDSPPIYKPVAITKISTNRRKNFKISSFVIYKGSSPYQENTDIYWVRIGISSQGGVESQYYSAQDDKCIALIGFNVLWLKDPAGVVENINNQEEENDPEVQVNTITGTIISKNSSGFTLRNNNIDYIFSTDDNDLLDSITLLNYDYTVVYTGELNNNPIALEITLN